MKSFHLTLYATYFYDMMSHRNNEVYLPIYPLNFVYYEWFSPLLLIRVLFGFLLSSVLCPIPLEKQ